MAHNLNHHSAICIDASPTKKLFLSFLQLELAEKYKELQRAGRLDRFLEKRKKRNAAKDHRYMPSTRRSD